MTIFIAFVFAAAAFVFVLYPLFKGKVQFSNAAQGGKLSELHSERDTTYSMLKELEFDYQSGILTEEDYRELESRYKLKAVATLRDIDMIEEGVNLEQEPDDDIEKEVMAARAQIRKAAPPVSSASQRFCTQCGFKLGDNDKFCAGCGTRLRLEGFDV